MAGRKESKGNKNEKNIAVNIQVRKKKRKKINIVTQKIRNKEERMNG